MAITLRQQKGAPLTYSELDANFTTIDSAANRRTMNFLAGDSDVDFGSHKILYSNNYDSLGALPSAATYHGMFAHVHSEAKGYYAHGGAWIKLADYSDIPTVPDSIGALSNINIAAGVSNNQILKFDSASQKFIAASDLGGGGGSGSGSPNHNWRGGNGGSGIVLIAYPT